MNHSAKFFHLTNESDLKLSSIQNSINEKLKFGLEKLFNFFLKNKNYNTKKVDKPLLTSLSHKIKKVDVLKLQEKFQEFNYEGIKTYKESRHNIKGNFCLKHKPSTTL